MRPTPSPTALNRIFRSSNARSTTVAAVQLSQNASQGLRRLAGMACQELTLHFALRSHDGVEVGILGGDIVVRRGGWLARMLRESCPSWLQEVLMVGERRPLAVATAHYTDLVSRPATGIDS